LPKGKRKGYLLFVIGSVRKSSHNEKKSMKYIAKTILIFIFLGLSLITVEAQQTGNSAHLKSDKNWQKLENGLELATFLSPRRSEVGNSLIRVLRIDPKRFQLRLLNASALKDGRSLTAKQWCRKNGLVAAINASMYQTDYKTSVSLMRTKTHINNPRLSKDKTILAFDRQTPEVPLVKIIDRQCEDFNTWKKKYGTLVQSIRMISCKRMNVWSQQSQKWSTAAIGIDRQDKVLFIHVGSPYSTHDLINILQKLPLHISRAMYCEGGPQAQLYIRHGNFEYEFIGSLEINLNESLNNTVSRPILNVVGISLRKRTAE
jgi:hypothetical protein